MDYVIYDTPEMFRFQDSDTFTTLIVDRCFPGHERSRDIASSILHSTSLQGKDLDRYLKDVFVGLRQMIQSGRNC